MVSYERVDDRFPRFIRSDGVEHFLVPTPRCSRCYRPLSNDSLYTTCYNCGKGTSSVDGKVLMRIFAGALYISHIVKGHLPNNEVFAMKNRGDFAEQYAEVIQYVLEEEKFQPDSNAILVPIPQRQGSSNLAPRTLAMELARRLELDVHPEALESIRSTESQKKLKSHEDRKRNVLGSIRANVRFQRRDVLLVDDIVTFGCTMHEAAQVAESAGAGRVYGLAAAKDDSPRHLVNVGVLKIAQD